jgi:hypothetical protein
MTHRWEFFRSGGVDQVSLRDAADLKAIAGLDQKLWVALAMPIVGVDLDPATLALVDRDGDGRIRAVDIIDTLAWLERSLVEPGAILLSADAVALDAIHDPAIARAAKRVLVDLGKPHAREVSVADTDAVIAAFANTVLNGDGVVIPASAETPALAKVIEDAIACFGSIPDRSGKPGIDRARADELFTAVDARAAWFDGGKAVAGDRAAALAFGAVRAKLDDYFVRCQIAAFDPRGAGALGGSDEDLAELAPRLLSTGDDAIAKLPLARIDPAGRLALRTSINPAWAGKLAAFVESAVTPILGARDVLTAGDVATITGKLAGYDTWASAEPKTKIDTLTVERVAELAAPSVRASLVELIERDAALAGEYDQITEVARLTRLQRDGGRLLRNFVNFSDFYSKSDGVFQAGTLYIDGRALHLCVNVGDAAKHGALAGASDAYLVYCDIKRAGVTKQIVAALTNGDSDNIFVGRNGVFYDRDGNDWDATVAKIIANPISIREAFWSPYKKLVRVIEDTVAKRAAAADAEATAKVTSAGTTIGTADKAATTAAPPAPKKLDLGTVAAIGVAIGGIGTLVGALLGTMFGLGKWVPLGFVALLLLISGPAMLLAWLKLRRRNLGPILDANGWAVNGRARVNVAFGAAMTELAAIPKGSKRRLDDPFADKRTPWKRWVFLIVLLVLAGTWFVGKLDRYLPDSITSTRVLGEHAPAYKQPSQENPK